MIKNKEEKIPSTVKKIAETAVAISEKPTTEEYNKAFLTRQLVQATLPHSDPGNVPIWKRRNGRFILSIRSGWDHEKEKPVGYPYGSIPRLLLFWITTEALRTGIPKLELGKSLSSFMKELGLDPSRGGPRSDARRLKEQMGRLFRATISFDDHNQGESVSQKRWMDMQIASKGEMWWDTKKPEQATIWGSWIKLSEDFFNAILSAPVPVDIRALRALKHSPLALDLYTWATWRSYTTSKTGETQFVPWEGLMKQLGAEYNDLKNFKKKAKTAMRKVQAVYPDLKAECVEGGFNVLSTSKTSVIKNTEKSTKACR